jgi:hypothetical protein
MLFGAALYSNLLHRLKVVKYLRSLKNRQLLGNGKDHFYSDIIIVLKCTGLTF